MLKGCLPAAWWLVLVKLAGRVESAGSSYGTSGCVAHGNCNGHGNCVGGIGKCECYDGWGSESDIQMLRLGGNTIPHHDCVHRVCPSGKAWVDVPTSSTQAHAVAECSNMGMCDRVSGICICFDGFGGDACQRMLCPTITSDACSGHGTCFSMRRMAGLTNALPLSAVTTYTGAESSTTWDENKAYGCVCDSSWTVGLASGERQLPEFFGPDCSLRRCPSGDDPGTQLMPITATISSEDTSYSSDYAATKVLADDSDSQSSIWLAADGDTSAWFILDLATAKISTRGTHTSGFKISSFKLKNTNNHLGASNAVNPKDFRSTTGYTIEISKDGSTWTSVATGTLAAHDLNMQTITPSSYPEAEYVRFTCTAYSGTGCGLGYFQAFTLDDETDCSYVQAEGGYGTGAFGNLCHNDCSGRGICDTVVGVCTCFSGFTGDNCGKIIGHS